MLLLHLALLAGLMTRCCTAYTDFYWPDSQLNASQQIQLRVNQGIAADSELRNRFDFYRLYLSVSPPGWGWGPVCWLAWLVPLDEQYVNVTIPADVVPDQTKVRLSSSLIHKRSGRNNGWDYSTRTTLYGANGNWSDRELAGRGIDLDVDQISCFAYGCVRECANRFWISKDSDNATAVREEELCSKQCVKDLNPQGAGTVAAVPLVGMLALGAAAVLAQYL
ncbi:hypothetical protein F5X68DRAFT_74868 [Plectosphaerella plurivora]|uniref:Uncharacterized protein n=1 Tax=Plectosphaerella plurivora TaxID=936078 RepID=A0A9P9AEI2_9PEZI|nr:hypothetical protein F5X68DRAFT_74868 [Plectosphaerella plurivora]